MYIYNGLRGGSSSYLSPHTCFLFPWRHAFLVGSVRESSPRFWNAGRRIYLCLMRSCFSYELQSVLYCQHYIRGRILYTLICDRLWRAIKFSFLVRHDASLQNWLPRQPVANACVKSRIQRWLMPKNLGCGVDLWNAYLWQKDGNVTRACGCQQKSVKARRWHYDI